MGIFFTPGEIFDVAIGMEKNGISFYTSAAKSSNNNEVRSLYNILIGEEKNHLQFFQKSKESLESSFSPGALDDEYPAYLKALVDSIVFTPEKNAEATNAVRIASEGQALDFALGMERDSILFYLEMKPLMSKTGKGSLDKIIREERTHLERLSAMKDKVGR